MQCNQMHDQESSQQWVDLKSTQVRLRMAPQLPGSCPSSLVLARCTVVRFSMSAHEPGRVPAIWVPLRESVSRAGIAAQDAGREPG